MTADRKIKYIDYVNLLASMSSINDSGENEFAYEESNVVGKSENNPEEEDKKILKSIKKEIAEVEEEYKKE